MGKNWETDEMLNPGDEDEYLVQVMPEGSLEVLSKREVERLCDAAEGNLHHILRRCALAVLNWGSETDSPVEMLEKHRAEEKGIWD